MRYALLTLTLALLASFAFAAPTAAPVGQGAHFYFVQITDTHFGDGDNLARTQQVVEAINKLPMPIAFVIHTGDITNNNIDDPKVVAEGLRILGGLKAPIHYLPGNHDILPGLMLQATVDAYQRNFGPLATKFESNGVTFLTVCTEPLSGSFIIKGYDPLAWLRQALQETRGKPVIIFHHNPAVDDFYSSQTRTNWPPDARKRWEQLVTAPNVKAIIAGHFHRDELHWLGAVPLFVSAPVADFFGRQATFRIYEYDSGKISYRTQYIPS